MLNKLECEAPILHYKATNVSRKLTEARNTNSRNMVVVITVFAIVFVILLKLTGKTRQERLLDAVPGPGGYPIVGNLFDILQTRENYLKIFEKNSLKYGAVYKTWIGSTPVVHVSKAQFVEAVLGTKGAIRFPDNNPLVTKSLKVHPFGSVKNRNILSSVLCSIEPDSVIHTVQEHCAEIMTSNVSLCLLDIICDIILGVKIKAQQGENTSFVNSLLQLRELSRQNHKVRYYSDAVFRMTTHGKKHFHHVTVISNFIKDVIEKRTSKSSLERNRRDRSSSSTSCILDELLAFDGVYTVSDIQTEVLNLINSALECVDQSIEAVLRVLASTDLIVQEKIFREIKSTQNDLTVKDLQRMTYFDRVIKEVLRLFPPCPLIVKELERDVRMGNYMIPHGTTICIHVGKLHRDPESFPNPGTFNPDNFLPKRLDKRSRFAYIPFGILDDNCMGQKLSEIIQRTILISLIKKFKILRDTTVNDESYDNTTNFGLKLLPKIETE